MRESAPPCAREEVDPPRGAPPLDSRPQTRARERRFGGLPPSLRRGSAAHRPRNAPEGRAGRPRLPRGVRAREGPEAAAAEDRRGARPALTLPALVVKRSVEGGGYLNFFLDRPRILRAMLARRRRGARRARGGRQAHRRAHEHQSEQGRAHRAPPERRSRRRPREHVQAARPASRDPELSRRHGRAGGRRRRRAPERRGPRRELSREAPRRGDPGDPGRFSRPRAGRRAAPAGRPRVGPLRARGEELRGRSLSRGEAACHAPRHRGRRHGRRPRRGGGRHGRARGAPRRSRRALPPPHDGARGRELRPPAPRERHPRAPLLGEGLRAPAESRRRAARDGGQERGLLGHAARGRAGVRGDGGRRQDPRALERNGHVHRKGRRLPALEARRPRDRLRVRGGSVPRRRRLARVPRLGRRLAALPDPARRGGRRSLGPRTLRPRHGRHQRHRRAPVLSPEGRQARRSGAPAFPRPPTGPSTSRTRWSR